MGAKDFDDRLKEANTQLEKVSLRAKHGKIYMRAMFPPQPGEEYWSRRELGTGCSASVAGLKVAVAKARDIDLSLLLNRFSWEPWLKRKRDERDRCQYWVAAFEAAHWEHTDRSPTKEASYRDAYRAYLQRLPAEQPLTLELLRQTITKTTLPETASRQKICAAFAAIATFAAQRGAFELPELEAFKRELKKLKAGYTAQLILPEHLPNEEQIIETIESIPHPGWRFVAALIATYGLRPSEAFRIDTLRFTRSSDALRVLEATKTGARITYPCPASWRERFKLWEICYPQIAIQSLPNKKLGARVTDAFYRYKIPFNPYALRHAWCIRLAIMGVDSAIAAKWAGHSLYMHEKTYLQAISEAQFSQVFERMRAGEAGLSIAPNVSLIQTDE